MSDVGDNPQLLAGIVTSLGGTVHEGTENFTFEMPVADVAQVVPKLREFGIRCERQSEYVRLSPRNGNTENMVIVEARKL